jgi:lipoprotein-anchoring transpeptidase ErfK/SrfK
LLAPFVYLALTIEARARARLAPGHDRFTIRSDLAGILAAGRSYEKKTKASIAPDELLPRLSPRMIDASYRAGVMVRTRVLAAAIAACGGLLSLSAANAASSLIVPPPPGVLSPDGAAIAISARAGDGRTMFDPPPGRTIAFAPRFGAWNRPDLSGRSIDPAFLPRTVAYVGKWKPGTIVIDTGRRYLYLVLDDKTAKRYGVGVGRQGFEWTGTQAITRKAEWPSWTPPEAMKQRQPWLPVSMKGGPGNPLGARALYLGDTDYRIHGSNEPWTIGHAVSSGCIRMRNEDVMDLYSRVKVGTTVVVL